MATNANTGAETVGECPRCETTPSRHSVLVEYETDDGTRYYAECPECRDVVRPRRE